MPAVAARPRWLRIALGAGCLLLAVAAGVVFARFTAATAPLVQEPPRFTQLTFRRGYSSEARFAPDGQSVVYSAIWDSEPMRVYPVRIDAPRGDAAALAEGALKAVSAAGNIALASQPQLMDLFTLRGTLAQVPLSGGAPRELLERVDAADYAPDGRLAVVRASGGRTRLEYPAGTVVYETTGWLSAPRFSPSGDRIAFLEHPLFDDDRGWPAVVDIRTRDKRNLTPEQGTLSGLAWAPGGGDVCFASEATIRCVSSTAPSRPRLVLRSGPRMILHDVAPDGRMLVSAYMVRGRTQVAGASGRETDLSYQDVSFPVGVTADGQRLLFGSINYGVYVRGTDGKPAVRLADGIPMGFSPDGKFVLTMIPEKPTSVAIVPTGAGEMEKLPRGPLESHTAASWMPDGRRIVLSGSEPGHGSRLYLQERSGGDPRPISAEGVRLKLYQPDVVSSDGRFVIAIGPSEQPALYPTAGGDPVPVPGLGEDLVPIGWTDSPTVIFARQRALGRLSSVYKVDVRTGRRELWKALGPDDPTGAPVVTAVQVSAGGRYYAYLQSQFASDLFLVRGALDVPGREVAR
jgi:Tol biopolymer transport system component